MINLKTRWKCLTVKYEGETKVFFTFPVIRLLVKCENKDKPKNMTLRYTDKKEMYTFFLSWYRSKSSFMAILN